jgi:uncharacterized protein (DUF2235 family)
MESATEFFLFEDQPIVCVVASMIDMVRSKTEAIVKQVRQVLLFVLCRSSNKQQLSYWEDEDDGMVEISVVKKDSLLGNIEALSN